jgi:hypothetical protein
LASLEGAGLINRQRRTNGHGFDYSLTRAGEELRPVVIALGTWGYKWAATELRPDSLDAGLLMWFLRRRVRVENLLERQAVIRFDFHAQGARSSSARRSAMSGRFGSRDGTQRMSTGSSC